MVYNKITFIAADHIPSTSSVVCYHGPSSWVSKDRPDDTEKFVEVSSCSSKVRLHQIDIESDEEFVEKLEKLVLEMEQFVDYLKST